MTIEVLDFFFFLTLVTSLLRDLGHIEAEPASRFVWPGTK